MRIEVTQEMVDVLRWVAGRYGWSSEFPVDEVGVSDIPQEWVDEWLDAVVCDDGLFSCLNLDSKAGRGIYEDALGLANGEYAL